MERLVIVRTNPEQGKPVDVEWWAEGEVCLGTTRFPFALWLQFEKLVKDGQEARARAETREQKRIEVAFKPLEPKKPVAEAEKDFGFDEEEAPKPVATPVARKLARTLGGVSNLAREEGDE